MKKLFHLPMLSPFLALTACVGNVHFPDSSMATGADISTSKRANKQHNFTVEIVAVHTPSTERLSPPGTNYSAWMVTNAHEHINAGPLHVKNAGTTPLKRIAAFDFYFITVAQQGDLNNARNTEHYRAKI